MRKAAITVSILLSLATLAGGGLWWVRALSGATFSMAALVIVVIFRRFTRAVPDVPWTCQVAAALAVTLGVTNVTTGVAHSLAVVSLALKEPEFGRVQIMRLTMGAMLLYSGAMNIAMHRAIRAGRRWAVAVGAATALLFWLYLLVLLPLPGTTGAFRMLGPWTVYLLWLGAAAIALKAGQRAQLSAG